MEAIEPDLTYIIDLMKKETGILYSQDKGYIIISKLYPLFEKYHFKVVEDLIEALRLGNNSLLVNDVIDILTVNETSFYRDRYPFEIIDQVIIPGLMEKEPLKINFKILCAACSTGQEPYSIAMHFLEKHTNLSCEIVAIDISGTSIKKAEAGIYSQFEIQRGLPIDFLIKYFDQVEKDWIIKDEVKQLISFHQANLMDSLAMFGRFDIVFCRNLLIYFDLPQREVVVKRLKRVMNPGATLILGGTEMITWDDDELDKITERNGVYVFNSCHLL
jgi:chemotaxis protein methyltransferase CheR